MSAPFCECGCGERTQLVTKTQADRGITAGQYRRFLPRHHLPAAQLPYEVDAGGCWVWLGTRHSGYGRVRREGRTQLAHRWRWEQDHGPVPEGLELDHLCRNRACVNPDHLEAVTHAENVRRGANQRLTDEQVQQIRLAEGRQVDIAARFGIDQTYVSAIKKGKARV